MTKAKETPDEKPDETPVEMAVVEGEQPTLPDLEEVDRKGRGKTRLLAIREPFWVTSFTIETPEGDTLVVDREGVEIDSDFADTLIATAEAEHGVTIAEVSKP